MQTPLYEASSFFRLLFHFSKEYLEPDTPGPTDLCVQINHVLFMPRRDALIPHLKDSCCLESQGGLSFPCPETHGSEGSALSS